MKGKTTAGLRESLFETLEGVKSGKISPAEAKAVAVIAEKIIETADLELRFSSLCAHLDEGNTGVSPGPILLTQGDTKPLEPK